VRPFVRFLALLAALLVVLPAGALPAQYYCRWMGEVMTSCCCRGHDGEARAQGEQPDTLRGAACCELVDSSSDAAPGTREAPAQVAAAAVVGRLPIELEVVVRGWLVSATPAQARAPPGVGPPLFLSHCSLLI
jgi:hypothetical protein